MRYVPQNKLFLFIFIAGIIPALFASGGRNEEKLKKQRSTTAFKASLFFFPMLCMAVLFCFPFSAAAELITPLPYELATTTGAHQQPTTYGNAVLPVDLTQFTVDEDVPGPVFTIPLQERGPDELLFSDWCFVGQLGYYDGSDHEIAYSAVDCLGEAKTYPNVFSARFEWATTTLSSGYNYWVRTFVLIGGEIYANSYVKLAMFAYTSGDPVGTAVMWGTGTTPATPVSFDWVRPKNEFIQPNYNIGSFTWANVPTSSYIGFDFFIAISTSSDFSSPFVSEIGMTPPATPAQFGVSGSGSGVWSSNTFQQNLSTTTQVFARAYLRGINIASTTILATATTTWSFIAQTEYGQGYSTTTDVCAPDLNFIVFGLCRLFMPDMGQLYQYQALKTDLENKPPFGYFNSFADALSGVGTSTTSSIPFPDLSALDNIFTPIKTGATWLLWFSFGFWGFHKFREITL